MELLFQSICLLLILTELLVPLRAELSRKNGPEGLPDDTIQVNLVGSAGQSLGAFCPKGMTFKVEGDTNDYCGQGLSGAKRVDQPPKNSSYSAHENINPGKVWV